MTFNKGIPNFDKGDRYGDKYDPAKMKPPFSEEWTGYKRISLQKLEEIKRYEWTYIFKNINGIIEKKPFYIDYHELNSFHRARGKLSIEETKFVFSLEYIGRRNWEKEKSFYEEAIQKSTFPDDRKQIMLQAAISHLWSKYQKELAA